MPIINWHEHIYTTGIEDIDRQHKILFDMINDAYDCVAQDCEPEEIRRIVKKMDEYAYYHFETEEKMMATYEEAEYHKEKHNFFEAKTEEFLCSLEFNNPVPPIEVFRFLAEWLGTHILEDDMAFVSKLKGINKLS